jgi:hypothetical protein
MKNLQNIIFIILAIFSLNISTYAQATRTWISGVGDDVNPCSRTAPCKTWAGAISKTAAEGEICALDPGGFGAVTITKSITLTAIGLEAGILVAATNGITINAAATDKIILKGLDIEGLSSIGGSLSGVSIIQAGGVLIEDCTINGFQGVAGASSGINIAPTVNPVNVIVNNTRITRCNVGINVVPTAALVADVNIIGVLIGLNVVGVNSVGSGAIARLSNSSIFNNDTGITSSLLGKVASYGNNSIAGNTTDGLMTVTQLR